MNTLCRECGKPSTPEYADEHDGLCMACVHKQWPRNYLDAGEITDPVYIEGEPSYYRACVDLFHSKP